VDNPYGGDKDEPVPIPSSEVSIDFSADINREPGEKCLSKDDIPYVLQDVSTEKNVVIQFAKTYSLSLASKRFNIPRSTIRSWMQSTVPSNNPKFNSPGQGRKISYSKETDEAIVAYFKEQVGEGNDKFTVQDLCNFAKELVKKENPSFNASTGWAYRFLSRHNLVLPNSPKTRTKKKRPDISIDYRGRPLSYSVSTDAKLAEWVRQQQASGIQVSNTQLRNYARTIITKENPNFTASASWSQNFLLRHHLHLDGNKYAPYRHDPPKELPSATSTSSRPDDSQSLGGFFGASWQESSGFQDASITNEVGDSIDAGDGRTSIPSHATQECLGMVGLPGDRDTNITSSSSLYQDVTNSTMGGMIDTNDYPTGTANSSRDVALALAYLNRLTGDVASASSQAATSIPGGLFDRSFSDAVTSTAISTSDIATVAAGPTAGNDSLSIFCGSDGPPITPTGTSNQFINPENLVISNLMDTDGNLLDSASSSILGTTNPTLSLSSCTSQLSSLPSSVTTSKSLSYTTETDNILAEWVTKQQSAGERVTFSKLRGYAKQLIQQENPHFNASVGWVTPFLLRHNLDLSKNKKRKSRNISQLEDIQMDVQESDSGLPSESIDASAPSSGLQCELVSVEDSVTSALEQDTLGHSTLEQSELEQTSLQQSTSVGEFKDVGREASMDKENTEFHQQFDHNDLVSVGDDSMKKSKVQSKPKPRHTLPEKIEVVNLMRAYGMSLQATSRILGVAVSTLCGWVKMMEQKRPQIEAMFNKQGKFLNLHGAGRPLSYSGEKDKQIAQWVVSQQESGNHVTVKEVCQYACSVIQEENPNFVASISWARKFLKRHSIKLASVSVRKPSHQLSSDERLFSDTIGTSNGSSTGLVGQTIEVESAEDLSIPSSVVTSEIGVSIPEATHEAEDELSQLESLPISGDDSSQGELPVLAKPEYNIAPEIEAYLVQWTREKVSSTGCLSIQTFCSFAEELIIPTDRLFVATLDWAFRFLYKHNLQLEPRPMVMESERRRILCEDDDTTKIELASKSMCYGVTETVTIPSEMLFPSPSGQNDTKENELTDRPTLLQQELAEKSKAAREFSTAEKEEVVRYANTFTLQKAALKYGIAAPTVWRWRLELKLNSPRYNLEQKKKIVKYASQRSLKEAAAKFGLSTKTIQNWRKMFSGESNSSQIASKHHCASHSRPLDSTELSLTPMDSQSYALDHTYATTSSTTQDHTITSMMDTEQLMNSCASMSQSDCAPSSSASNVEVIVMPQECDIEYDVSTDTRMAAPRQSKWSVKDKDEILKFALEHTIRQAGEKFGVKSSTLYNWKKTSANASQPDITLPCSSEVVTNDSGMNSNAIVITSSTTGMELPVSIVVESSGSQDEDVASLFPTTSASLLSLSPAEPHQFMTDTTIPLVVTSPTLNTESEVNFRK